MLELPVEVAVRRGGRIRAGVASGKQVAAQVVDAAVELLRGGADRGPEIRLMELEPAFAGGGDESDSEAAAPVPEQISETGGAVVLVGTQLGVREHAHRHEEE